jgi:hypothetical protein
MVTSPCSLSLSFLFFPLQSFSVWLAYSCRPPPLVSPILFFPFTKFASSLCCAVLYHGDLPPVSPLFTLQSFESSMLCCDSWRSPCGEHFGTWTKHVEHFWSKLAAEEIMPGASIPQPAHGQQFAPGCGPNAPPHIYTHQNTVYSLTYKGLK